MKKEDFVRFINREVEFMTHHYPHLKADDRIALWGYSLTFDFRDHPYHDPLDKFNVENYEQ